MNYYELQRAKETFQLKSIQNERQSLYRNQHSFLKKFSIKFIAEMTIDDYAIGKGEETFCFFLENTLKGLGSMNTRLGYLKFGVWWAKDEGIYKFDPKFGHNYKEAFEFVRKALLCLLKAGANRDYSSIVSCPLYSLFSGKVLSVYYPEMYLNIFSNKHLNHYLISLDLDTKELLSKHSIYKRNRLLEFKNSDPDMKNWSVDMFAVFLWDHYPKDPRYKEGGAVKPKEKPISFQGLSKISFVNLELSPGVTGGQSQSTSTSCKSSNYEVEAARAKQLGDRGEHIVMEAEVDRLVKERGISKKQASTLVKHVSRESDSYGYDILSVNFDSSPRYIEVKATQGKVGDMTFFYTSHELETARKYGNSYYLYVVYEITTSKPKIAVFSNPFLKSELELIPTKYRVTLKTK